MRSMMLAALLIPVLVHSAPAEDKSLQPPIVGPSSLSAPFDAEKAKAGQEAWAKHLGKSSPVEKNSIGMELILIPPGKFTMGSPESEADRQGDEAQVDVTLTKAFYVGKTEVTQRQWRDVMGTTPWKNRNSNFFREGDNYPATYVAWDDAQAFCKKLSEIENMEYRLPTEAEWEYACRGGSTSRFSFGDDDSALSEYAWWGGFRGLGNTDGTMYDHEVGQKKPNPFGLHDMHGNAWEWCEDEYADNLPGGTNPLVTFGNSFRVDRGGGSGRFAKDCRSAERTGVPASSRFSAIGFRVARNTGR